LARVIIEILPKIKSIKKLEITQRLRKNSFSYELDNIFTFPELESYYYFLSSLPKLNISIITSARNKKELFFILRLFEFQL